jgi:carbamoyl-phosphate synthase large subunit
MVRKDGVISRQWVKPLLMKNRNILVFPAGTEIGLEIFKSLHFCKGIKLFGAGQDISNHALFAYPEYHALPPVCVEGWANELSLICIKYDIDYIFPAHDDVVVALSNEKEKLPATVISSPSLTCQITRSKTSTYRHFENIIRVPKIFESPNEINDYPVIVKPDKGQGSLCVTKAIDMESLERALNTVPEPIICEYLPGDEYTVDCFSDRDKGLMFVGIRNRRRTRNGISMNTITEHFPEVEQIAYKISQTLDFYGAWFFQLKRSKNGEFTLLEIATRIAGAMATHRVAGINFPLLSIYEVERLSLSVKINFGVIELDRALANRYHHTIRYSILYLEIDNTLIINDKVNIQVVTLIFQCINKNKKIVLITRYKGNLYKTLADYRLSNLFDEIIRLQQNENKSSYITHSDAIYLDNSFTDRMEVSMQCNVPTFDCSMIELLTEQAEFMNEDINV